MIKKNLLWLWIAIISLINFWNTGKIQTIWLDPSPSIYNTNYNLTFLKWWWVLTNFLWQGKSITAFSGDCFFRRTNNWEPYFYCNNWSYNKQWFFGEYRSCDEITWYNSTPTNCTSQQITGDYKNLFKWFFKNVVNWDLMYYDLLYPYYNSRNWWHDEWYRIQMCWSSNNIWKSICFRANYTYTSQWWWTTRYWTLINSQNLSWLTYWLINNSRIWYAPWQNWYDESRENEENNTIINTTCPTIRQLMNNMWNQYNTGLCYNNTTYFNGESFETVTKDDIFTIFNNDYENYTNRISIYRNNCNSTATQQNCQKAFSGEYKKYSIISNAINWGADEKKLWNYCNMWLNYDPNATNCVASWYIKEEPTTEELLNEVTNTFEWIITPNTNSTGNTVFNSLCNENDPECYVKGNVRDVFWSLGNIYNKIVWLFEERKNVQGIIPDYILRITFITILFTIIFKK